MKRFSFLLCVFLLAGTLAFAIEETWMSVGVNESGVMTDTVTSDGIVYWPSVRGLNLAGYSFSNRQKSGFFYNYGFSFDDKHRAGDSGINNPTLQMDFLFGPVFRSRVNSSFNVYFGFGVHSNITLFLYEEQFVGETTDVSITFGLGADLGLKLDISDAVYLNAGIVGAYDMWRARQVEFTAHNGGAAQTLSESWERGLEIFRVRAYVAIGFNWWQETPERTQYYPRRGKPSAQSTERRY